ncbi:SAM-dependent methyltransferase [Hyphomicrobium methylovorum]|uniref:class I SAM-dependent methyltransferase n=1 Tax=Hyphomicrobium methylovorum TaxID=84 RepID=UPI0015E6E9AB|nr:SAM-dependent methyltransferase [Hyphomicrobium methylovorum]MBA2127711.1 SAM-dependent methyltransferase [Hyphomicrobium methylovorum]
MAAKDENRIAFIRAVAAAAADGSFLRMTLGKFRGEGEPRKAVATPIVLKGAPHIKFVTSFARKDETKNFAVPDAINHLKTLLGTSYLSVTLFTPERNLTLGYSKKRVSQLVTNKATDTADSAAPDAAHDRAKAYLVAPDRPYLSALGVADGSGRIKPTMQGKYRQICRFIEIADGLLKSARSEGGRDALSIVDIGSGKGYLTFALYDYVTTTLGRPCRMTGIEIRDELVQASNALARDLGFANLIFEAAEARKSSAGPVDVVIALHACDTATDDALAIGVNADAQVILAAPCCQHELAPQIDHPADGLAGLVKYPLLKQRQADLVTDAARALLLEAAGYKVKIIEFVSTEHTAKNLLIAASKSSTVNRDAARRQYRALKELTGFATHHLDTQLKAAE